MLKTNQNDCSFFNEQSKHYSFCKEQYIHDIEFLEDVETLFYTISKGTIFKGAFYKRDGLKKIEIITHTGGYVRLTWDKIKIKNTYK